MTEALVPAPPLPSEAAPTLEEFAHARGVSTTVAANVLTHKDTAQAIHEETKARALLAQAAITNRLIKILNGDDDKTALTAAGLLLKLGGNLKGPSVNVRVNFDQLMKEAAQAQAGPLGGITQIVESTVIDADEDEYGDDTE